MRKATRVLSLLVLLLTLLLPPSVSAGESSLRLPVVQGQTPEPTPTAPAASAVLDAKTILKRMSVADKVGQLFLVSFQGTDVGPESDIATLVRDYRVGGVVLQPANDNFRNVPVVTGPVTGTTPSETLSTPVQIALLANTLQSLAMEAPRPLSASGAITSTAPITSSAAVTGTVPQATNAPTATVAPAEPLTATVPAAAVEPAATLTSTATAAAARGAQGVTSTRTPRPATIREPAGIAPPAALSAESGLPLFVALDWVGDDSSFLGGHGGFTPLPSSMALGATWSSQLAEQAGQVMGDELQAAGVNLLLGPTLDVLDQPRPGNRGDLGTRSFGGDPFWVGQIGQAFIRGVQDGSQGGVVTAAKHFPGQGGSDRGPEDEVATVQKSVDQLRQIELAPFATVTAGSDLAASGITPALMTSHIRYRGFQGNIRETTPPISLAPQLQDLMELPEFAPWRSAGGVLISDQLGVPALRRYYSPTLTEFPHRRVAQDAFLAGNDLLYLGRFALTDNWADQMIAIKETILFFQEKYKNDSAFAARVDAAVERIVSLKLRTYNGDFEAAKLQRDPATVSANVGESSAVTRAAARAGMTLIYPGRDQFADRMPAPPAANEKILIFTDARDVQECAECKPAPVIEPQALQRIILDLYGPDATGQIAAGNVSSFTFAELRAALAQPGSNAALESAIDEARWIVFAQLDQQQQGGESSALSEFLSKRSDGLRDKRLIVFAFAAPYYLDTTEISKLTAYFGVYAHTAPYLESAVRALFREFTPSGAPPVTVTGINYELINQLEPASGQIIALAPVSSGDVISGSIRVGSQIELEAGPILDRNGHNVPDGTPVEFSLRYPTESLVLAPKVETTVGGKARTVVPLDRPGELWITASSGEAKDSTRIELRVGGDAPGSIATVIPSPTPTPTHEPTITPSPTATLTVTPEPTATPAPPVVVSPPAPKPRVVFGAFLAALIGAALSAGAVFMLRKWANPGLPGATSNVEALVAALYATAIAWIAYLLYAVGWLPGATVLQSRGWVWAAGAVTFIGGMLTLLWTLRRREV